ncbi:RNase adapter RapZ [Thiovibrio sp. JS02]
MSAAAQPPSLTIITGLSGAGKSTALNVFEDAGFYCIDNLPVFLLLPLLTGMAAKAGSRDRLALVMDARDRDFLSEFPAVLSKAKTHCTLTLIFLDAGETILLRRFSQLRRAHPLSEAGNVREAIQQERRQLAALKKMADCVIDTTGLSPNELRNALLAQDSSQAIGMRLNILSFGHKHGLPEEADLLFDVRFLPNPYWVPELKEKTGKEREVADYALANETGRKFLALFLPLIDFLLPLYESAGKAYLTLAVGCTGGRHRSVAVAEALHQHLSRSANRPVFLTHRDMGK